MLRTVSTWRQVDGLIGDLISEAKTEKNHSQLIEMNITLVYSKISYENQPKQKPLHY